MTDDRQKTITLRIIERIDVRIKALQSIRDRLVKRLNTYDKKDIGDNSHNATSNNTNKSADEVE